MMSRTVKVFDTVVREFWFEIADDFDLEDENATVDLIERCQSLEPVDESGVCIRITVDDDEFYG